MKRKILFVLSICFIFMPFSKVSAMLPYEIEARNECENFELAIANNDGTLTKQECYESYEQAKTAMNETENDDLVIIEKGRILDAKYALIDYEIDYSQLPNNIMYLYEDKNGSGTSEHYIKGGSPDDAILLEVDYSVLKVKVMVSGFIGWMSYNYNDVKLFDIVPLAWVKSPQKYVVTATELIHHLPKNVYGEVGSSYKIDQKPSMLEEGTYYSYDGHYFYNSVKEMIQDYQVGTNDKSVNKDEPYYNYYQYLSFRTKTNYSAENINDFLASRISNPESKLLNTGEYFINAQEKYGVNAILMLAIGINESGFGNSGIAQTKNNLFGLNAKDSSPGASSSGYESVENCIEDFAYTWLSFRFLQPGDYRFKGANLGNKGQGLNIKYASDPFWGEKAASYYYQLDKSYDFQDKNSYQIAVLNNNYNNEVYPKKTVNGVNISNSYYQYKVKNSSIVVLEEVEGPSVNGNNIWYKIQIDPVVDLNLDYVIDSRVDPRVNYLWDTSFGYVPAYYFIKVNTVNKENNSNNNDNNEQNENQPVLPNENENQEVSPTPVPTPTPTPEPKEISLIISESGYVTNNDIIKNIKLDTQVLDLQNNLISHGGEVIIKDINDNLKTEGVLATGDKVIITSGSTQSFTVVITGDINGDGKITAVDYVKIKNHIMSVDILSSPWLALSADVNGDGKITAVDYVNIKNYIMGNSSVINN